MIKSLEYTWAHVHTFMEKKLKEVGDFEIARMSNK